MKARLETVRSLFLLGLIISSILQAGILWNYQNDGFPAGFMSELFSGKSVRYSFDLNKVKSAVRKPLSVIASSGRDGRRWILARDGREYEDLCHEFSYYLTEALSGTAKQEESRLISDQDWYESVVSRKAFIFEYGTNINMDLLAWMYGIKEPGGSGALTGVYKAALLYEDSINENEMVFYLTDGIYLQKYMIRKGSIDRKELVSIITGLYGNSRIKTYSAVGDYFGGTGTKPDILFMYAFGLIKDNTEDFDTLKCIVPEEISTDEPGSIEERNRIAANFLGNESFESDAREDGSIVFVNLSNIFRVLENGLLQYRYKPTGNEQGKGGISEAFARALEFMYKYGRIDLAGDISIILTGINDKAGSYEFLFDYYYNEFPVVTDYVHKSVLGNVTSTYSHAASIEAGGDRVISADWIIRRFKPDDVMSLSYDFIKARDSMIDTFRQAESLDALKGEGFTVNSASICYLVTEEMKQEKVLEPVWIFRTNVSGFEKIVVEMQ